MGKYDFTSLPNRFGHHTYKWKEAETDSEVLPAWIADMDFVVLPENRQKLCRLTLINWSMAIPMPVKS